MKAKWFLLTLVALLTAGLLTACGGGGGDDDDSGDDDASDDDALDDDSGDDDADDDIIDDDTTDDDTTPDDDTADDDVTEYEPPEWYCDLPAITGLNAGETVGGGAIGSTITVYVFDDSDCSPLEGASVISGGTTYTTDTNGLATVTVTDKANILVTAYKDGYWSWAYQVDAAIMAFRLRPDSYGLTYTDSSAADFLDGGTALDLENPQGGLSELFGTIYLGGAVPGISRYTILSQDFDGLLAQEQFTLDYFYNFKEEGSIELPRNIYVPEIDLNVSIIGYGFGATGSNEQYVLPVMGGLSENPIEGLVLSLNVGSVLDTSTLITIITTLISGGSITDLIADLAKPIINDALAFDYVAANPTWDGSGAPNLDVIPVGDKETVNVTFTGTSNDYDYLAALAAEIPNRALLPMALKITEDSDTLALPAATVPDARYVLFAAKTDLLASGLTSLNLGFALKFAENLSEWSGGATIADSDFLPLFDSDSTAFNETTAETTWAFEDTADVDVVLAIYVPADGPWSIAVVNGEETSYTPPVNEMGITPSADDIVVLVGLKLPDSVDPNAFDPTHLLNYDSLAMNVWTNYDLTSILPTE